MADLFTPPAEKRWCWVCESHRETPMVCGKSCIADMYPRKDTHE